MSNCIGISCRPVSIAVNKSEFFISSIASTRCADCLLTVALVTQPDCQWNNLKPCIYLAFLFRARTQRVYSCSGLTQLLVPLPILTRHNRALKRSALATQSNKRVEQKRLLLRRRILSFWCTFEPLVGWQALYRCAVTAEPLFHRHNREPVETGTAVFLREEFFSCNPKQGENLYESTAKIYDDDMMMNFHHHDQLSL